MSTTPPVIQHAGTPPGNIPKGRQTYIMIAVAVTIVLAIVFSGSATTSKAKPAANLPPLTVATPNKREIDAYAADLKAAEVKLNEAKLNEAKLRQAAAAAPSASATPTNAGMQGGIPGQAIMGPDGKIYYPAQQPAAASQPGPAPVSVIAQEKEKMEFTSLFASPVALSLRPAPSASAAPAGTAAATAPPTTAPAPSTPTAPGNAIQQPPVAPASVAPDKGPATDKVKGTPQHTLFEGTIFEAVLTNRLAGSFSGPVNCMITTNVYSHDHQLLIIPQGTRVLGEARRVAEQNQQRLAVSFHRLIMPDGFSVNLDQFPGLDQAGATGLKDKTNNHYFEVFGTSIALGVLAGFSQFGTGSALTAGGLDSYRQGVASQVSQNSTTVLQRQLNRLPDITIREGQRVRIYLMKDLELPAYLAHEGEKQ